MIVVRPVCVNETDEIILSGPGGKRIIMLVDQYWLVKRVKMIATGMIK